MTRFESKLCELNEAYKRAEAAGLTVSTIEEAVDAFILLLNSSEEKANELTRSHNKAMTALVNDNKVNGTKDEDVHS